MEAAVPATPEYSADTTFVRNYHLNAKQIPTRTMEQMIGN